jgi:hypothetical protein
MWYILRVKQKRADLAGEVMAAKRSWLVLVRPWYLLSALLLLLLGEALHIKPVIIDWLEPRPTCSKAVEWKMVTMVTLSKVRKCIAHQQVAGSELMAEIT